MIHLSTLLFIGLAFFSHPAFASSPLPLKMNLPACPTAPDPTASDCVWEDLAHLYGVNTSTPPANSYFCQGSDANRTTYICLSRGVGGVEPPIPACPESGANCSLYSSVQLPGPIARGYERCTTPDNVTWACCPEGKSVFNGTCVSTQEILDITGNCCPVGADTCTTSDNESGYCSSPGGAALACQSMKKCVPVPANLGACCLPGQTTCTTSDNQAGYCVGPRVGSDACESRKVCEPLPEDTSPGTFNCNCGLGQGVWVCKPGQPRTQFVGTTQMCTQFGVIDESVCRTYNAGPQGDWGDRPDGFCTRSDGGYCNGELPCLSILDGKNLGHGEECDLNDDKCDLSQNLSCQSLSGGSFCAYAPGTRGGPTASREDSSCFWNTECIYRIGLDDSPANRYVCVPEGAESSVECDHSLHSSCSCVPPEGTWCGVNNEECGQSRSTVVPFNLCKQVPEEKREVCYACMQGEGEFAGVGEGIWTAFGCVSTQAEQIIVFFTRISLGIAGIFALLQMVSASFMIATSAADVQKASKAKDTFTSAITGILFIIFSVSILQFIGVRVLQIPGLGQ